LGVIEKVALFVTAEAVKEAPNAVPLMLLQGTDDDAERVRNRPLPTVCSKTGKIVMASLLPIQDIELVQATEPSMAKSSKNRFVAVSTFCIKL
jgi:hypothetical protein